MISLIVPVHNEESAIRPFLEAVTQVYKTELRQHALEIVFVNDGSTDRTEFMIRSWAGDDMALRVVNFSRNFGKEAALSAGLTYAKGDAVIPMDVDLQDPPCVIPQMVDAWLQGAKVVNARRKERGSDTWFKRTSASAFYRVFNALADHPIPQNVGDFRLLDREVVQAILELGERSRFNKALFSWVGFETREIEYERPAREHGSSRWSYWKLWKLALDGIFASSTTPLRIWTYVGIAMSLFSLLYSLFILFWILALGIDVPGYASTLIIILTFGGLNMFALGIIGEYVGRIYEEVRQRPLYVVQSVHESSQS
ncbi:glycosyltransferase [Novosphingobium sp. MBES04]|uniref:glycosyltransferase n=1 Tax=Novosphingobium sp. MBES04 TaxID=1206458 RepID=UPI000572F766|nr:glycosyltransferase [Novosphingobium sp. MBES04]GAM07427.1 bactoprenol glucosyl transferase [Novosphingobium sp. MBES04]